MNHAVMALDTTGLDPSGTLDLNAPLIAASAIALVAAVALIVAAVLLSRPSKRKAPAPAGGAHAVHNGKEGWQRTIDDIVKRYKEGILSKQEAFAELAAVARGFASEASGSRLDSHTLVDIKRQRHAGDDGNWVLLRQTIAALYPPEFADGEHHPIAKDASVAEAAGWVSSMVERWR